MSMQCPIPINDFPRITLAHGGGGTLMNELIEKMFVASLDNPFLQQQHDGALLPQPGNAMVMTTDSFVVKPLFFPGGDIGKLAVDGTLNDLAACGARPSYLSLALVIEEGFEMERLWKIVQSIAVEARKNHVDIVTGDTKVVEHGKGDGVFINTTGIGEITAAGALNPSNIKENDAIIVTGDLGRHGISIMASREGLDFETSLESDCACLWPLVELCMQETQALHCARDLTRGGLVSCLNEIADSANLSLNVSEAAIPIHDAVRGACEILGFDPFYVACEGRMVLFVAAEQAEVTLRLLKSHALGRDAAIVGKVTKAGRAQVVLKTAMGVERLLERFVGEQLPRIC